MQALFRRARPMLGAVLVTSMLAAGVGFAGTAGASVTGADAGSTALVTVEPASTALLPAGTHILGALNGNTELQLDVNLQLPDPAAVESFIAAVDDSSSPLFHHYLARGQFGARFGPSEQTVSSVVSALRAAGLQIGPIASNRLSIPVSGAASRVEAAFHTHIDSYRLADGRVAYANSAAAELPGTAAAAVSGIVGLSDVTTFDPLYTAQRQARSGQHTSDTVNTVPQRAPGPQACPKATAAASKYGAYTSNQLASFYGMSPLYGVDDFGQGVYVGLVEFDTFEPSNIATFEACFGTHTPLTITKVDGFHKTGVGGGEPVLDIEDFLGLAPGATVDVYETPNTLKGAEDIYKKIITDDVDNVVSTSWGECELDSTHSFLRSEQSLFMQAATQGQAVFAAAGDSGSTDCYLDTGSPNTTSLAVDDPSSQPYVVGVGGTSITGSHSQSLWNTPDIEAATGGGDSAEWCMPSYQYTAGPLGVINPNSDTMAGCSTGYARQVPDVSADANPYTGLVVYYSAQFSKQSGIPAGWQPIGGTSVAAPIWAALASLTDASPFCSSWDAGTPGGLPQALYGVADGSSYASGYYDVTKGGSNDLTATGYKGGLYPVRAGYDMATGLGTPVGVRTDSAGAADWDDPGLVALTCRAFARHAAAISGISPDAAPLGHAVTAEIRGSGFVPLPGAESVEVGSRWLSTVDCTTTTSCTVTLPAASAASKVDVRVEVGGVDTTEPTSFAYDKVVPEGYWLASSDGSVFSAGSAPALGGVSATGAGRITGIAATPDGRGYWLVGQDGSVSIKGDAHFFGDLPQSHVVADDIVAIAPTGDGGGYWLIGRDGGEFAFGDARFHGSLPGVHVHVDDITGMVATSDGGGYWLVASDGGIFAFGDATYVGSLPGVHTHTNDITAMIASPTRRGYVLVGRDGGTFVFGSGVQYFGSLPSRGIHVDDISGLALTGGGLGYWLAGSSGAVYGFGDAESFPTPAGIVSHRPIVAIAAA